MRVDVFGRGWWLDWVSTVVPQVASWAVVGGVLVVLVVRRAFGLLLEWQRRLTLLAVVREAPEGTVVIQEQGPAGVTVKIRVGRRARRR